MRLLVGMGNTEFLRTCRSYYMTRPEWLSVYSDFDYAYYQSVLIHGGFTKSFFIKHKIFILMEKKNPFARTSTANLLSKLQGGKESAEDSKLMAEVLQRRKKLEKDLEHFLTVADAKPEKKSKKGKDAKPEPIETKSKKKDKKAKEEPAPELTKKEKKAAAKLAKKAGKEAGKKKKKKKLIVDLETYKDFCKGDHVSFPANAAQKTEFKSDTLDAIVLFIQGGDSGQPYARIAGLFSAEAWKVCNKLTLIARADKVKSKVSDKLLAKNAAKKEKAKAKNEAAKADAKKEGKKGKKKGKK